MANPWQRLIAAASLAAAMVLGGCDTQQDLKAGDTQAVVEPGDDIGKTFSRLTAQQLDAAADKGIRWTLNDVNTFLQQYGTSYVDGNGNTIKNCVACHRAPVPLFGASLSAYTGYNVNMSTVNGVGYLADFLATRQRANGTWTHSDGDQINYNHSDSAVVAFGMAGYTQYASTRYLSNLQRVIDWAMNDSYNVAQTSITFPNDTKALQGVKAYYVKTDRTDEQIALEWNAWIPTAQFAIATRAALDVGGLPTDKRTNYEIYLRNLADYLVGSYVRTTPNTARPEQIAYAILGALADKRDTSNPSVAAMRDELLSRTVNGAWGDGPLSVSTDALPYKSFGDPNAYSTGMALYALCRLGVRSDQNTTVANALTWLLNQQCSSSNSYCSTNNASYDGAWYVGPSTSHASDVPSTFAVLALGCYGSLNAQVTLSPTSVDLAAGLNTTQTTSFNVTVKNTGYVTNTYNLTTSSTFAGMTVSHNNPSMTLDPNGSGTDTVTLVLPASLAPSQSIPVSVTVSYLTPSGPATKTVTFTVTIPPVPIETVAQKTYIASLSPANGTVYAPGSTVPFAATVRKVVDNSLVTQGTLTFYSGGVAIRTVSANNGTFAYNWTVPTNAVLGPQTFTATYNGYATDAHTTDLYYSSLNGTYTIGYGNGATCANDIQCQSGYCVDGVCCNTACGGGDPTDCQACSQFAGGTTDGTCGASKSGVICRGSRGICDIQETCNGTSTTCGADSVVAANTACGTNGAACNTVGACTIAGRGLFDTFYNGATQPPASYSVTLTNAYQVQPLTTDWTSGSPMTGVTTDNFAGRFTGELVTLNDATNPTRYDGVYKIGMTSDEGVRLWVDGKLLIDNWTAHTSQYNEASIYLKGGGRRYSVKIEYYEKLGNATAMLYWTIPNNGTPAATIPGTNLNPAISNPVAVRFKSPLDRTSYSSTSSVVVDVEAVGMYGTITDVTLYVNGTAQTTVTPVAGQTIFTWTLPSLSPGLYTLSAKVNGKGYTWKTDATTGQIVESFPTLTQWATPTIIQVKAASGNGTGLTADYFNGSGFNTFAFTRSDYTVSLVADGNTSNTLLQDITNIDNYSVRWTGKVNPIYSEVYTFSVQTNQQAKVWVNNTLLVDTQNTQFSGTIGLSAGVLADIKVEYTKNNSSNSLMKLYWQSISEPKGLIPGVRLYPNTASTH